ncbi:preprotein translocase subunit YajC [Pseudotenacibaculum sp. MALMAid0570]|uniref:preprotein translocase subunit YajC n=1 Tax=Pseudotenacibaculum sp. MALMAid0570 TaxID=3143938 RepID=UPI0032DECA57
MLTQSIFLQAETASPFSSMLPFLAIIIVFYFFMILPQSRKRKKEKKFREELKRGSKVITSSGIHGKIVDMNDTDGTVTIETGAGKIKFEREAISVELSKKYNTPQKK